MLELITYCKAYLNISKPVRIELKDRIYRNYTGVSWTNYASDGSIKCHVIKVSLKRLFDDARGMNEIIAHEFVHVWQAEHKPIKKKYHTPSYIKKANSLRKFLNSSGFNIGQLYYPNVDKS